MKSPMASPASAHARMPTRTTSDATDVHRSCNANVTTAPPHPRWPGPSHHSHLRPRPRLQPAHLHAKHSKANTRINHTGLCGTRLRTCLFSCGTSLQPQAFLNAKRPETPSTHTNRPHPRHHQHLPQKELPAEQANSRHTTITITTPPQGSKRNPGGFSSLQRLRPHAQHLQETAWCQNPATAHKNNNNNNNDDDEEEEEEEEDDDTK